MQTLFFTLIAFVAIILLMSIGFIIKKQSLKGSCGGISTLGMKKVCDCEEPCDNLKSKIANGTATPDEISRFSKDSQFYEVK
ncbi:(Na+)-NQR maturation NqrM [Rodentibacter caecimuris]|uniref:Na(+)-translocating NADH-quinone reductase subunit E n=1 Tax=Rodentibacter caecimuris TaxID=1796644 RepID=A0ABX3L2X9_9PAST|nr:hypothetical protein BKG89_00915 [Rodentibacter heylii]